MSRIRRRLRFALVLVSGLGLVACGGSDGGNGSADASARAALLDRARGLAATFMEDEPATSLRPSWGEGVLMLGMLELSRVTGDPVYADYAYDWVNFHRQSGYVVFNSDSCPPGTVASVLMDRQARPELQSMIDEVDEYLFNAAPRTRDGGLSHNGFLPVLRQQLWVDSLFMFGEYLIQTGKRTGDARYLDLMAEQFELFGEHMQVPGGGLFTHSWNDITQRNVPPFEDELFWARGNSWVLVAGFDLASSLEAGDARRARVLDRVRRHEAAILPLQDASGLYWNILNRPGEIYLETAGSGLITYGLARGLSEGLASPEAREAVLRGMDGLLSRLEVDGDGRYVLEGTSLGTNPGPFALYAIIPLADNVSYGVGSFLLSVAELSDLDRAGRIDLGELRRL